MRNFFQENVKSWPGRNGVYFALAEISAANMCFPGWVLQFLLATEFVQLIKTDDRRSIQEDLC